MLFFRSLFYRFMLLYLCLPLRYAAAESSKHEEFLLVELICLSRNQEQILISENAFGQRERVRVVRRSDGHAASVATAERGGEFEIYFESNPSPPKEADQEFLEAVLQKVPTMVRNGCLNNKADRDWLNAKIAGNKRQLVDLGKTLKSAPTR